MSVKVKLEKSAGTEGNGRAKTGWRRREGKKSIKVAL